ncbi:MAG: chorismate mutase [Treponema sp.]|nr:chorismate mutase [Treponema sp.]
MIDEIRSKIDKIDDELASLFAERLSLVGEIANIKKEGKRPILNTAREREIITRLTNDKPDDIAGYTKTLYTTIFDLSRSHQAKLLSASTKVAEEIRAALENTPSLFPKSAVVACQGTEGANSMTACERLFERPSIMYFNTFEGVFAAVDKGLCQYGILPIENSLHGSVTDVYDLMNRYRFSIVQSAKLKINHALLAKPGVKLADIRKIYSHEQALGQCSEFLKGFEVEACENTALAAKMISEGSATDVAAISSIQCAELYNLSILSEDVQNSDNNYTKFICISKRLEIYPGARKISLMTTVSHRPGSLYQLIAKFAALGINMTKLESRVMPNKDFEAMFYFDFDLSVHDNDAIFNLFSQLEGGNDKFVFLGCYSEV